MSVGISDRIEAFILELLKQEEQSLKIQRNELAEVFGCVPSQINYVISTRFCPERGYIVTSRRGGGGYMEIQRVENSDGVADKLSEGDAYLYIKKLRDNALLSQREAQLMACAISDMSLMRVRDRDSVRADILKNMTRKLKEEL